jgi:hypothetical protein
MRPVGLIDFKIAAKNQALSEVNVPERLCETNRLVFLHMHVIPLCLENIHCFCLPGESYAPGSLERLPPYSLSPAGTKCAVAGMSGGEEGAGRVMEGMAREYYCAALPNMWCISWIGLRMVGG